MLFSMEYMYKRGFIYWTVETWTYGMFIMADGHVWKIEICSENLKVLY